MLAIRGKLMVGLVLALFSASALAQTAMKPNWVKDGVDWSQYNAFLVKPLDIDDVRMVPPPWAENPEEWELNIENLQAVQAIYRDVVKAELGYPVVYTPAPGVLELDVEILSVTPWLRPGSDGTKGGMQVTTMGTGELSASVEIRDAQTRELLLMIASEKSVGEEYKEFTQANNVANIEKMFKGFAHRLRAAMDTVHGK